jgi:PAS domain S-box-containing protein
MVWSFAAVDGQDAIEKAKKFRPDLVILDFSMPVMNGLAAARILKTIMPAVPITSTDKITQSILDELPVLRMKADRAIGLLASIVDSSDDAIVSETLEGVIISWNAGAERLLGYTAKETIGQHISMIIPRDRLGEEKRILRDSAKATGSIISTPFACAKMALSSIYHCQFHQSETPQAKSSVLRK